MTRILLIRHGAVALRGVAYGQRVDPDLSDQGCAEVTALADRLTGPGPAPTSLEPAGPRAVVRSPTLRTRTTTNLLGWHADRVEACWSERDLGAWEGRPWSELWEEAPAGVTTDPARFAAFTPPGGESVAALQQRISTGLEALADRHQVADPSDAPPVAVVCHSGPITCALAHVLGLDVVAALRLRVATATATWLTRWPDGGWTVEGVAT